MEFFEILPKTALTNPMNCYKLIIINTISQNSSYIENVNF